LWLHLRERDLSHRLVDDYRAVVEATCEARRRFHELVRSVSPMVIAQTGRAI
jgi:hypothetical protein